MRTHKLLMTTAFAIAIAIAAATPAFAESAGQYIDDATVTAKVKAALMADPQAKATKVSVETTQGVVQLSGAVDNKGQESAAVQAASKIDGVKSVKDLMSVKGAE